MLRRSPPLPASSSRARVGARRRSQRCHSGIRNCPRHFATATSKAGMTGDAMRVTVLQERDIVARWVIYAGVSTLIFLLALGAAATWVVGGRIPRASSGPPRTMVPREVNLIDQTLFAAHQSSTGRWAETRRSLN